MASVMLAACASGPQRAARGELRLDTETAGKLRHAAAVGRAARAAAPSGIRAAASNLLRTIPGVLELLRVEDAAGDLEARLVGCVRQAELQVNSWQFGDREPTRAECGEKVDVDACGEPITRAMLLGRQKHALALQCARKVLEQLWPAPFSIEQRYRYYPNARVLETVSREEEARLIAQGCTSELWRTIKPDIVLHADHNLLRAVVILDLKFPCPSTNEPRWMRYGGNSAYTGSTQGRIYQEALGGEAFLVSPAKGVTP